MSHFHSALAGERTIYSLLLLIGSSRWRGGKFLVHVVKHITEVIGLHSILSPSLEHSTFQ